MCKIAHHLCVMKEKNKKMQGAVNSCFFFIFSILFPKWTNKIKVPGCHHSTLFTFSFCRQSVMGVRTLFSRRVKELMIRWHVLTMLDLVDNLEQPKDSNPLSITLLTPSFLSLVHFAGKVIACKVCNSFSILFSFTSCNLVIEQIQSKTKSKNSALHRGYGALNPLL